MFLRKNGLFVDFSSPKKKIQKLDIDLLSSYDNVAKSVETAIETEMKLLEQQMKNFENNISDDMKIDEEMTSNMSKVGKDAALKAMHEYLESHNIRMTGPWKATADQRVQRHIN